MLQVVFGYFFLGLHCSNFVLHWFFLGNMLLLIFIILYSGIFCNGFHDPWLFCILKINVMSQGFPFPLRQPHIVCVEDNFGHCAVLRALHFPSSIVGWTVVEQIILGLWGGGQFWLWQTSPQSGILDQLACCLKRSCGFTTDFHCCKLTIFGGNCFFKIYHLESRATSVFDFMKFVYSRAWMLVRGNRAWCIYLDLWKQVNIAYLLKFWATKKFLAT